MSDKMASHGGAAKPLSAREKIARLRDSFVLRLPERMAQAHALLARIEADAADRQAMVELHRLLHSLKGTGRSFGFAELGGAVGQCEALAVPLLESAPPRAPQGWTGQMALYLSEVDVLVNALCLPGGDPGSPDEPAFSLPVPPVQAGTGTGGRMVYICDDEVGTLEQLAIQLACFGYETQTFVDPDALRQAVLARQPDAVIMDIHFPQGHDAGTETLAALRRESGLTVPAIFLSARGDFAARLAAVQAGGVAYFHKPVRAMELVAVLDDLTRQHQPEPLRILIIDDEPEAAAYHGILLQGAGMLTYQLSTPHTVLDVLQEFRPDLVLMDMYMPECNGRDLATLIRQVPDYVGLPIVFLSSETDKQRQFSAMRMGAEGFLIKPVVPQDLVAAVAIRAERMRTLRSLMARDSLTGLFNHTTTTQLLESAMASAQRGGGALCFAMIDLDHFKAVNDGHGHPVGDQVLLALSRVLLQRLRNSDIVGRYGGEEFAIVLPEVTAERALQLIDGLRQDFRRLVFHSAHGEFSCTFSAGIASFPRHRRMESLRAAADQALYEAKRRGRNCVVAESPQGGTP